MNQVSLAECSKYKCYLYQTSTSFCNTTRYFDSVKMGQLTESVKEHGILEPLLVRELPDGEYELVAGERRYRAAKEAGLEQVPISVRELDDEQALQIALIENLQREDLNPVEETEGILDLLVITLQSSRSEITSILNIAAHAKRQGEVVADNVIRQQLDEIEKVFALVGTLSPESFRTNRLPLLNLPEEVLDALRTGQLEYTKARAIAKVKLPEQRQQLLEKAIAENMSLTQIQKLIESLKPVGENTTLKHRLADTYKRVNKAKVWNDPKKQKRLEKLLAELESLVSLDN